MVEHTIIEVGLEVSQYFALFSSITGSIFAGVTSSFIFQWIWKKQEKANTIKDIKKSLKTEIDTNLKGLKEEDLTSNIHEDGTHDTTLFYLETSVYDSTIQSGNFVLLNNELKSDISEIYTLGYLANRQSDYIGKFMFEIYDTHIQKENWNAIEKYQYENLEEKHQNIIKKFEDILKLL